MSPWHSSFIQNKRGPIFRLSEYRELPLPIPGPGSLLPAPTCLYKKLNLDLLISWEQMVMDKRKRGGRVMLHLLIHTILFKEGFTHIALPGLFQERGKKCFGGKTWPAPGAPCLARVFWRSLRSGIQDNIRTSPSINWFHWQLRLGKLSNRKTGNVDFSACGHLLSNTEDIIHSSYRDVWGGAQDM